MNNAPERMAICQICLFGIQGGATVARCPECHSPYHQECWNALGGCAVYGCPRMIEIKKAERGPVSIWGSTRKTCPMCAEQIPAEASQCPHCKLKFAGIRPMDREELLIKATDPAARKHRRKAVWMMIFSVLGFTSPLVLALGGFWYRSHKKEVVGLDPTVRGVILVALGVSVAYLLIVAFAAAVFWAKGGGH